MCFKLIPYPEYVRLTGRGCCVGRLPAKSSLDIAELIRDGLSNDFTGDINFFGLWVNVQKTRSKITRSVAETDSSTHQRYCLTVTESGAVIQAESSAGRMYGVHTLAQIVWNCRADGKIPGLKIIDGPSLPIRGVHICYHLITEFMPVSAPDFEHLCARVKTLAHYKCNLLLLEIESMFPYKKHPKIPCRLAFSKNQMRTVARICKENHIEILPLVQCLGHAYNVLRHSEYAHLREVIDTTQQYCPRNPGVRDFYLELIGEIREVFPNIRGVHIGGDESRRLGVCDRCRKYVKRFGPGRLYGEHIGEICRRLIRDGLKPYVWADMIEHYPESAGYLPEKTTLVYWNYDMMAWPRKPALDVLMGYGLDVITAGAARFGLSNHTMYLYSRAMRGIDMLARESQRKKVKGMVVTDWMKSVPYEIAVPSLLYALSGTWDNRGCSLRRFEKIYGCLYFGLPENLSADLGELYRLLEELVPFCEDTSNQLFDRLDRYDVSGPTVRETLSKVLLQETKDESRLKLDSAIVRGKKALAIADKLLAACQMNRREIKLLRLSALLQVYNAEMGLGFLESSRVLRYPAPGDALIRKKLVKKFRELIRKWPVLREETRRLLKGGTFSRVVEEAVSMKFKPESKRYMEKFLDLLEKGSIITRILELR